MSGSDVLLGLGVTILIAAAISGLLAFMMGNLFMDFVDWLFDWVADHPIVWWGGFVAVGVGAVLLGLAIA